MHILHDRAKLRRDKLPKITVAFLAVGDDFPDFFALLRRQVQSRIQLFDELLVQHLRARQWQFLGTGPVTARPRARVVDFRVRAFNVIDEQPTRHHATAKNHRSGQNDFPGIHCAWSF